VSAIVERLARGERRWLAEFVLRVAGLVSLLLCALLSRVLSRLAEQAPPHSASPLEFLMGAAAFACLSAGLALLIEGAGLFRPVPMPPRALISCGASRSDNAPMADPIRPV